MCSLIDVNTKLLSDVWVDYSKGLDAPCIASRYNLSVQEVKDIINKSKEGKKNG